MSRPESAYEQAQKAVIGALLLRPQEFHSITMAVEELTLPDCRRVFEAITELWEEGITPDALSVADWTEANKGRTIDMAAVAAFSEFASFAWEIPRSVAIVRQAAQERQVRLIAEGIMKSPKRGARLLAEAMTAFNHVGGRDNDGAVRLTDATAQFMANAEAVQKGENRGTLVQTGVPDLDKHRLLERGGILTIAGQTSMGKTALIIYLMSRWAEMGERILYISTETPESMVVRRFLANTSGTNSRDFGYGDDSLEVWAAIIGAAAKIHGHPIWIDDKSGSLSEITKSIRRERQLNGITIVVIDYLQECIENIDPRNEMNQLLHATKRVCREEPTIALVQLSQLGRSVEKRESRVPQISDLKESGSIEQATDGIIFILRPWEYRHVVAKYKDSSPGVMWVKKAKTRDGPKGWFGLSWDNSRGQVRGVLEGRPDAEPE
jgi:replicative DNA helicase